VRSVTKWVSERLWERFTFDIFVEKMEFVHGAKIVNFEKMSVER